MAAVSGASWLRTLARIVLPQTRLGIAAAWIVVFVLAFGELGVTILVAPPGDATLPIRHLHDDREHATVARCGVCATAVGDRADRDRSARSHCLTS